MTLPRMYEAARRRALGAMFIFGEDVVQTDPDQAQVVAALQSLELLMVQEIARVAPPFAGVSYTRLEGDGLQWPVPSPDHPGTTILHEQRFGGGRARLACVDYAASPALVEADDGLVLVTGRALEHYNSGSMTRRSPNVELRPRDFLQIHPDDARASGIADGDGVEVKSRWGTARATADISDAVAPGTLFLTFHFPESGTNRVTSDVLDRLADCPEYKVTSVTVRRV